MKSIQKLTPKIRRIALLIAVLLPAVASADRPNILYIFTDDQTHRSVSAYEEARPWVQTPEIDRLAESGMRFTQCYTGAWCQPSRASALSGLLQHAVQTLEITDYPMAEYDPEQLRFFPSVLRKHGYQTACIGKWHLGEDVGHGRDWDYSVIWDRGAGNGRAYYNGTLVRTNGGAREPLGGYSTDRFTELAVDYIESRQDSEQPWYLWLCYGGVHGPYTPAERHSDHYADAPPAEVPVDVFGPRPTKPEHLRKMTRWKKNEVGGPCGYDDAVKKYHRAVLSLDDGVGALMQALQRTAQLENTIVIFTSDQGYAWGQHGCREKWLPYDATICAPLIVSIPGRVEPGSVCLEPVNGVDIARTIHSLAGVEPEWQMHGRDFSALLDDPASGLAEPMLMVNTIYEYGDRVTERLKEGDPDAFKRKGLYAWIMMRDGKYKYIRHFKEGALEELYDMTKDPKELNNLAVNPDHASVLESLRLKTLTEFRKKDGGFVDFLPAVALEPAASL